MKTEESELRMSSVKFNRMMRRALQTKPPDKEAKAVPVKKTQKK
ncbi:MAG: hypothetical protein ACLP7O_03915 [Terracidiphilus sp.]